MSIARRQRLVRLGGATIAMTSALVACNALTGLGDDYHLKGDAADPDSASSVDGAPGGEGDSATLARADAEVDAGPLDGAQPDAATPDDAGPFCNAQALVADAGALVMCTDFERPASGPAWGWTGTVGDAGTVAVKDAVGADASRGLEVTLPVGTGVRTSYLSYILPRGAGPGSFVHYRLTFDFVVTYTSMDFGIVGSFAFQPTVGALTYHGIATYKTKLDEAASLVAPTVTETIGKWHSVSISLDRVSTTYNRTIVIDGTTVDQSTAQNLGGAPDAEVRLGLFFTSAAAADIQVAFDNVVVRRN